jgi:hypothetical protein
MVEITPRDRPAEVYGEDFEFGWADKRYRMPLDALNAAALELGSAADAVVMPHHCIGAVSAIFSAALSSGWAICPPPSASPDAGVEDS